MSAACPHLCWLVAEPFTALLTFSERKALLIVNEFLPYLSTKTSRISLARYPNLSLSSAFGLFGRPFRKILKNQLINYKNKKEMLVEIEFTEKQDSYLIRRGLNPQVFEIIKNGELINQNSKTIPLFYTVKLKPY